MKFRLYAVLVAAISVAGLNVALIAPASAAATDPVSNIGVSQTQIGHGLQLTATWDANPDASHYRAYLTDQADGNGAVLAFQDTASTTATITTSAITGGQDYWLAVKPISPATGLPATAAFTAEELDATGPTGTYTLNRTSGFLVPDYDSETFDTTAVFTLNQTSLSDNTTAPGGITRTVSAGDGTPAKAWNAPTFKLTYAKPGVFSPTVQLTDEFGNSSVVALPTVTVIADHTAPKVRITLPANPSKIASWRRVHVTATDAGSGLDSVLAFVVEKRGRLWYAYDFSRGKWLKGFSNLNKTVNRSAARPAELHPTGAGTWQTPVIRGLRKGPLHVEAVAFDKTFNVGIAPNVNHVLG